MDRASELVAECCSSLTRRIDNALISSLFTASATYALLSIVVTAQNCSTPTCIRTYIQPFNGPLSGTTQVSRYQKGKTNLDFTEARGSEWQWHQLGRTSLQTDNHASTPQLSCLQAGYPSCRQNNSVKALKARNCIYCSIYYTAHTVNHRRTHNFTAE